MAEATQIRLRCPKCENFLPDPELPDFSLYQCGGCGAVLRAKKNGNLEDRLSEVSVDVEGSGQTEECNTGKVSRIDGENTCGVGRSLVNMESKGGIGYSGMERNKNEGLASHGGFTPQPKRMDVSPEYDEVMRGKERMRRMRMFADEYESYSRGHPNRNRGKYCDLNVDRAGNVGEGQVRRESVRSRPVTDQWGVKSNARGIPGQLGSDEFLYADEGPSSYVTNTIHEQGGRTGYQDHAFDEFARIESLENGRADLLRKLDELKDQIARSCDVSDKHAEGLGIDPMMLSSDLPDPYGRHNAAYVQGGLVGSQGPSRQPLVSNGMPMRQYASRPAGFVPYNDMYGLGVLDSYSPSGHGYPRDFLHLPNVDRSDMIQRPTCMPDSHYGQRPYNGYAPGYYGDANPDLFMLHRHENFFHQPACSCVHCHEKNWRIPPNVDHPGLHNQRLQQGPSNPNFHQNQNPLLHQSQSNNYGGSNIHPKYLQQPRTQHANDMDSDNDGVDLHCPRKFGVLHRRGRVSYPIAGGAPFMTCDNCFELLKLSKKHISLAKNQHKMKCGACSSIILFELGNKGLISSVSARMNQVPSEIVEGSNGIDMNSVSNNFDNSQQNFEKSSSSGGSKRQLDPPLSSPGSLYDEGEGESPRTVTTAKHESSNADLPEAEPDVPAEECPESDPENGAVTQFDEMAKSERWEKERASFDISNTRENYVEASGVATEISVNGLSNSYVSQDSLNTNKDHSNTSKGAESFFAAFIRKGFKDFMKADLGAEDERGQSQVFVNGHLIPDRAVKKAERLAGKVRPGDYWYDKNAGFWGVMGHPCIGIIMPNIEEFNYPMPKDCAAGNTGVYVNGRELNQRDLDLLAKRGLPTTENRSYIVKITGEVVDEQTREELDSLGKLAPTVLRAGCGFGMKVYRFLAQPQPGR